MHVRVCGSFPHTRFYHLTKFTTSRNHTSQSSDPVTAKSDTEVNDEDNMNSELTVTPDSDTTYTCSVTDPLGNKADPKTAKLNVFGRFFFLMFFVLL